eukprot:scaffold30289_cov19-Tisochrysis_lutea.AAC.2
MAAKAMLIRAPKKILRSGLFSAPLLCSPSCPGDQRAMGAAANLKAYDIDTSEAGDALKRVYEDICGRGTPMPGVEDACSRGTPMLGVKVRLVADHANEHHAHRENWHSISVCAQQMFSFHLSGASDLPRFSLTARASYLPLCCVDDHRDSSEASAHTCCILQVGNLPDEYFSSAEIAAAGGLVENIAAYRRRDEYYTAMQRALLSVDLVSKG